jgi:hypothetical protein
MTAWWLCAAGVRLRNQINARWPERDHTSDGSIGDASHLAVTSDHNPAPSSTPPWVVRAIDIDEDFTTTDDERANQLVAQIIKLDDARVAYIIFEGVIYRRRTHWVGAVYYGRNAHKHHIHVSFSPLGDRDDKAFALPILEVPT